jgi:peptide/nickel transport system substrate-binding protein
MWKITEDAQKIVNSGAWKLQGYKTGERASFVRNLFYGEWNKDSSGKALPYMDGTAVTIATDDNAMTSLFLTGQVDLFGPNSPEVLVQIKEAVDGGSLKAVLKPNVGLGNGTFWITFNWNRKSDPEKQRLFRSPEFRRAMSHLIDRQGIIDLVYGGVGHARYVSFPPWLKDWISPTLKKYDFNLEAARGLLAKLGYVKRNANGYLVNRSGRVLEFDLQIIDNGASLKQGNLIVEGMKQGGVKVNLIVSDNGTIIKLRNSSGDDRPFDALFYGGMAFSLSFPFDQQFQGCTGVLHVFNRSGKCLEPWETQVDVLFARGLQELDLEKRRKIAFQIEDLWSANQPFIYLPRANAHLAWNARLAGEYPAALINSYNGDRDLVLTWIR